MKTTSLPCSSNHITSSAIGHSGQFNWVWRSYSQELRKPVPTSAGGAGVGPTYEGMIAKSAIPTSPSVNCEGTLIEPAFAGFHATAAASSAVNERPRAGVNVLLIPNDAKISGTSSLTGRYRYRKVLWTLLWLGVGAMSGTIWPAGPLYSTGPIELIRTRASTNGPGIGLIPKPKGESMTTPGSPEPTLGQGPCETLQASVRRDSTSAAGIRLHT